MQVLNYYTIPNLDLSKYISLHSKINTGEFLLLIINRVVDSLILFVNVYNKTFYSRLEEKRLSIFIDDDSCNSTETFLLPIIAKNENLMIYFLSWSINYNFFCKES